MHGPTTSNLIGAEWYRAYYAEKGADRNSLLCNSEVLFQMLARDASLFTALRLVRPDPYHSRVLDVGCGAGESLAAFLRLGFLPKNLCGIDFQAERVDRARNSYPRSHIVQGDASCMNLGDGEFDLVHEAALFIHSVDADLSKKIASEMLRVTRPGGHILLCDWRYAPPRSVAHQALTRRRIASLFAVGRRTRLCGVCPGALLPPVGRSLSRYLPSLYFLTARLAPVLVGQVTTVLCKL